MFCNHGFFCSKEGGKRNRRSNHKRFVLTKKGK